MLLLCFDLREKPSGGKHARACRCRQAPAGGRVVGRWCPAAGLSETQAYPDGYELSLVVELRYALIPGLDKERCVVIGRDLPSESGVPRAVPATRGALHSGHYGKEPGLTKV